VFGEDAPSPEVVEEADLAGRPPPLRVHQPGPVGPTADHVNAPTPISSDHPVVPTKHHVSACASVAAPDVSRTGHNSSTCHSPSSPTHRSPVPPPRGNRQAEHVHMKSVERGRVDLCAGDHNGENLRVFTVRP
jgi:hypothetical protein